MDRRVDAALDLARPQLLELARTRLGGELALICLALVHDKVPHDDETLASAVERLDATKLTGTYELSIRLMVMAAMPQYPDRDRAARRDLKRLLRNQTPYGGFGYQATGSNWDLSNTQYGALGMRAAVALGCEIKQTPWKRLRRAAARSQRSDGGFSYRTTGGGSTPPMTVAGIAVLEICGQHLSTRGVATKLGARLKKGWAWMEAHVAAIGGPEYGHPYYFHYGLERAAILSGISTVAGTDWYAAGAERLLRDQGKDGTWNPAHMRLPAARAGRIPVNAVATSFAVLFLRRQFQRRLTPVTQGGGFLTRGLPDDATDEQIARAVELDVGRGLRAVPDLLKALRSSILSRRKAAALSLAKISGKDFGFHPYREPSESVEAVKAAERWWLTEGRKGLDGGGR